MRNYQNANPVKLVFSVLSLKTDDPVITLTPSTHAMSFRSACSILQSEDGILIIQGFAP
jgi:hypothetical protein